MPKDPILEYICWLAICVGTIIALILLIWGVIKLIRFLHVVVEIPFTFDQELREHMLPTGVYEICGHQRVGKGSLGCAIMDTDATYHGEERKALAQEFVDELNAQDDYDLDLPENLLYYSKNKMLLTPDYVPTYHVDVLDVALPETEDDMHFAPYSMFHLEEADAVMNARTWSTGAEKKANVIDGEKWCGHHNLTILIDGQVHARFDAAVRALTTDRFYVYRRRDYYSDDEPRKWWQFKRDPNHVIRTEWDFLWIKNQIYQSAEELNKFGDFFAKDEYIKKCKFVYYGNIYERYNSKSGQKYWLKNIKNFACASHPEDNLSRKAVNDYCNRNARHAENATSETEK